MSEQGIWEADQKHPAFRVVCRMLRAGQAFSYLGNSKKAQCVTDIGRLLGYLYDTKTFPVRGGRSFIAGNSHAYSLCSAVSLLILLKGNLQLQGSYALCWVALCLW